MAELKYKVIRSKTQYKEYSKKLENLIFSGIRNRTIKDEIELLTLLIEKWDSEQDPFLRKLILSDCSFPLWMIIS